MSAAAERVEQELREHAALLVRAGLGTPDLQVAELAAAVREQMPHTDAEVLSRAWLLAAQRDHRRTSAGWPAPTDHDRLLSAWEECRANGVLVNVGVDEDTARTALGAASFPLRGALWCTAQQVHTAVAAGILDLQLWDATGTPVRSGDGLVAAVVSCVERHGLPARWHESRVQVATWWRRRA